MNHHNWHNPENRKAYLKGYFLNPINKERNNRKAREARKRMKEKDLLHYKAMYLISGLRWGKGATAKMEGILKDFIGKSCIFCSTTLTLENCSLDHNIPAPRYTRLEKKRRGMFKKKFSSQEIRELNNEENLHIICLKCNRTKGNLSGSQFMSLLHFLDEDPEMKKIVLMKLRSSNFVWQRA